MSSPHLIDRAAQTEVELRASLIDIVRDSAWLMAALLAVRNLGLESWCIGAGAVRSLVWDRLHEFDTATTLRDVDVAYFDATVVTPSRDAELQARLNQLMPGVPWEVTNQASVHHWYELYFGHPVAPLHSLDEAIASWPEYATSVGVTLLADDTIEVIAPHGLQDLFSLTLRHNPTRASKDTFHQRLKAKRFTEQWPRVTIAPT